MMTNNYRIYGTALLLLEVIIVALGVKFVQLLAPVRFHLHYTTSENLHNGFQKMLK